MKRMNSIVGEQFLKAGCLTYFSKNSKASATDDENVCAEPYFHFMAPP